MTNRTIPILALALAACGPRFQWSRVDTALELASAGVQVTDWHQTNGITRDCVEGNPIIGRCGQRVPPAAFFPLSMLAHAAIARALPHPWRTIFQAATIGYQADAVVTNLGAGYAITP